MYIRYHAYVYDIETQAPLILGPLFLFPSFYWEIFVKSRGTRQDMTSEAHSNDKQYGRRISENG